MGLSGVESGRLDRTDVLRALRARGKDQEVLHRRATQLRHETFGNKIVLRGVIDVGHPVERIALIGLHPVLRQASSQNRNPPGR